MKWGYEVTISSSWSEDTKGLMWNVKTVLSDFSFFISCFFDTVMWSPVQENCLNCLSNEMDIWRSTCVTYAISGILKDCNHSCISENHDRELETDSLTLLRAETLAASLGHKRTTHKLELRQGNKDNKDNVTMAREQAGTPTEWTWRTRVNKTPHHQRCND